MRLKQMLIVASMALTAIALAAPAAHANAYWTDATTGETIGGEEEAASLQVEGHIFNIIATIDTTVPLTLEAAVWNEEGAGVGEITTKHAGTGTIAGLPPSFCKANVTLLDDWSLSLGTDEAGDQEQALLDIENVRMIYHYSEGCQEAGIPAKFTTEGSFTITVENEPETHGLDLYFLGGDIFLKDVFGGIGVNFSSRPSPLTGTGVHVEQ